MAVSPTYPGVYVQELPSGVHTIMGVATSRTAFLGRAARGPVNDPTTINSFADFERTFGGLWTESRLGHAVRDFFMNGGGQAVIVRVHHPSSGTDPTVDCAKLSVGNVTLRASSPGAWGNKLRAVVDTNIKGDGSGLFNLVVQNTDNGGSAELFRNLSLDTTSPRRIDKVLEGQSALVRWDGSFPTTAPAVTAGADALSQANARLKDASDKLSQVTKSAAAMTSLAVIPGQVNLNQATTAQQNLQTAQSNLQPLTDDLQAALDALGNIVPAPKPSDPANLKNALQNAQQVVQTVHDHVANAKNALPAKTDLDTPIKDLDTVKTDLSANPPSTSVSTDLVKAQTDLGDFPKKLASAQTELTNARMALAGVSPALIQVEQASGGSDGADLVSNDLVGDAANKTGIYALENTDLFNLLYIPPYSVGQDLDPTLVGTAVQYCQDRRAMLILDPPVSWTNKDSAVKGMNNNDLNTSSGNAMLYFPRLVEIDPLTSQRIAVGAGGAVAGLIARTDLERGVWKAPAGLTATINGALGLDIPLTDAENGELNPLGINCLRTFPAAGTVVWGARTLEGDDRLASEWKYIPVRRLALYIEESLYRGVKWAVFEPNDEPLWAQLRLNVGAFMHDLFRQGAFQGQKATDAYFVRCDSTTTTQSDIDRGIVNVVVGFAPLKPAEFVILSIQQIAGQLAV